MLNNLVCIHIFQLYDALSQFKRKGGKAISEGSVSAYLVLLCVEMKSDFPFELLMFETSDRWQGMSSTLGNGDAVLNAVNVFDVAVL